MELNTTTLLKEIYPFNDKENNYVDPSYSQSDFTKEDLETSNYKMYQLAYSQYAKKNNYNLKSMTYHFVAPKVSKETYELAFLLNYSCNTINGVDTNIKVYTYQNFYQSLLNLIPKSKWYIQNNIPANCLNKQDVLLLIKDNKATLV